MIKASELARHIDMSTATIYRKASTGELPCYRLGTAIRFKLEEVELAMKGEENAKKRETRCRSNLARK